MSKVTRFPICFCLLVLVCVGGLLDSTGWSQPRQDYVHYWEHIEPIGNVFDIHIPKRLVKKSEIDSLQSESPQDRLESARLLCRLHPNLSPEQKESVTSILMSRLKQGEEHEQIRMSMASAVVLICGPDQAEQLWEIAKADSSIRPTVERALIQWHSPCAIELWRARLKEPMPASNDLLTALEGMAVVGTQQDAPSLIEKLSSNRLSTGMRVLAARSLGQIMTDGLNDLAQRAWESDANKRELIAANLLVRHSGDRTKQQLNAIIVDGSPSATAIAARALMALDPMEALQYAPKFLKHADNNLRMLAIQLLHKLGGADNLNLLASALNDKHLEVRTSASKALLDMADHGQSETIEAIARRYIDGEQWEGLELSIAIAAHLKIRSLWPRFVSLLDHPRPEVNMAAGYALRELGDSEEALAATLAHAERVSTSAFAGGAFQPTDQIRMSYLFEGFGKCLYQPSYELMLKYVPKNYAMGAPSRASAIWAIGKFNHRKDNAPLRLQLHERILDNDAIAPEMRLVKYACLLTCGEMGKTDAHAESLVVFREFQGDSKTPLCFAANWAAAQIENDRK